MRRTGFSGPSLSLRQLTWRDDYPTDVEPAMGLDDHQIIGRQGQVAGIVVVIAPRVEIGCQPLPSMCLPSAAKRIVAPAENCSPAGRWPPTRWLRLARPVGLGSWRGCRGWEPQQKGFERQPWLRFSPSRRTVASTAAR